METSDRKNILIIEPHRPEFFWEYVATELGKRGHQVVISKTVPFDVGSFDIVLKAYLDEGTARLSKSLSRVPIIAFAMGTDVIHNAHQGTDFSNIDRVVVFNQEHELILRRSAKRVKTKLIDWFANDKALTYKERRKPKVVDGKIKDLVLINSALHTYLKGLDNLVQMLNDCTNVDLPSCTLHVIGPIGEVYLSYFLQDFCVGQPDTKKPPKAKFRTEFHGEIHPKQIDSYVESIDPHFTIMASQGEMAATTVIESLFKGIPPIVQDHPFIDGVYQYAPIHRFSTASELNQKLLEASTTTDTTFESKSLQSYAKDRFTLKMFCDKIESLILDIIRK